MSEVSYPTSYRDSQGRYASRMQEDFHSPPASPDQTDPGHRPQAYSQAFSTTSMTTSTMTPSNPGDRAEDKARHFSDGSQVNYAELTSPAPQVIDISKQRESDKEAYRHSGFTENTPPSEGLVPVNKEEQQQQDTNRRRRICGLPLALFWGVIAIIILALALGLGLGLGLGLKKHGNSTTNVGNEAQLSQSMIGGAINPKYYSRQGAFNGTGIAVASTSSGVDPDIFVFYQRYDSEIHQLLRSGDGSWHTVTTVATDAKNATAISAVAYVNDNVATIHVFYLNKNNLVRQRTSSNASQSQENIWFDGPLNQLNLQSIDGELVGLQACYWGNYYGAARNSPTGISQTTTNATTGINLYYASDNTTFSQYDWTNGQNAWNRSNTFPNMNTKAGIGCQTWLNGTTQYIFMVDLTNTIQIMWRDTDLNKTSTAQHPINKWTNTDVTIPNVHPASSLGYTDFLAYQSNDSYFRGVDLYWGAENTKIETVRDSMTGQMRNNTWVIDGNGRGIPSSHMAITALDTKSGGRNLAVFYQSIDPADNGGGITIQFRDSSSQGSFLRDSVPVNGTDTLS